MFYWTGAIYNPVKSDERRAEQAQSSADVYQRVGGRGVGGGEERNAFSASITLSG